MARSQQGDPMTDMKLARSDRSSRSDRSIRSWLRVAIGALCLMAAVPMSAMVVVPAEFSEMVTASELVVHGRVVGIRSQVVGDRRTIETVVTVAVLDALKGQPGDTVYFRVPGGQVGRYRRLMMGAPEFVSGEEIVLFLKGRAPSVPFPFGLSQGVYRVVHDAGGRSLVTPPTIAEAAGRVVRGDPSRRPVELSIFARNVRSIAERAR
jgi:hypothetical protein